MTPRQSPPRSLEAELARHVPEPAAQQLLRVDSFVDCAGLGSLVELAAQTRASGGGFEVSAASRSLIRLSELTGRGEVLRIDS